jgi:hypothetical protein
MRRTVLLALVLVTANACQRTDQVTASAEKQFLHPLGSDVAGIYVLRSVAGKALPAVIASHESYHAVMLSDTIFLHADGSGGESAVKRVTEGSSAANGVRETSAFSYTLAGNRLTGEIACNDVVMFACSAPPHYSGTATADGLELDVSLHYRAPLRYAKVAGATNVASVRITPDRDLTVATGGTLQLAATARDAEGRVINGRTAFWSGIMRGVATLSETGLVRGVAPGGSLIVAFIDGRADTVRVNVK